MTFFCRKRIWTVLCCLYYILYYHRRRVQRQHFSCSLVERRAKLHPQLARVGTACPVTRLSAAAVAKVSNACCPFTVRNCKWVTPSGLGSPRFPPDLGSYSRKAVLKSRHPDCRFPDLGRIGAIVALFELSSPDLCTCQDM